MSQLTFAKMHGAGNDFIVIDCPPDSRGAAFRDHPGLAEISALCDRKRGIGADGLFFLTPLEGYRRMKMDFYNSDGSRAEMCGNGLRCAAFFASAKANGWRTPVFETDSGTLETEVLSSSGDGIAQVRISLPLKETFRDCGILDGYRVYSGNTGVRHAVIPVRDTDSVDVAATGRFFRCHSAFSPAGTNVDFVETEKNTDGLYRIRTYERGVEAETLACGTGIAAAGIVLSQFYAAGEKVSFLSRSGDKLEVEISKSESILYKIHLTGPAVFSFFGSLP